MVSNGRARGTGTEEIGKSFTFQRERGKQRAGTGQWEVTGQWEATGGRGRAWGTEIAKSGTQAPVTTAN